METGNGTAEAAESGAIADLGLALESDSQVRARIYGLEELCQEA